MGFGETWYLDAVLFRRFLAGYATTSIDWLLPGDSILESGTSIGLLIS